MSLRLKDMGDLRRYMAGIINQVRDGTLEPEKASKLGYLCNIMSKIIHLAWEQTRMQEIEERLAMLEEKTYQRDGD